MAKTWRVRLTGEAPGDSAQFAGQTGVVVVRGLKSSDVRFGRVMVTLPNDCIVTVRDEPSIAKRKPKPKPKAQARKPTSRKKLAPDPKSKTSKEKAARERAKKKGPKRISVRTVSGGGFETNRRRH